MVGAIWKVVSTRSPLRRRSALARDDQDRHVAVLQVIAAVLGDLRLAAGVDDAVLGYADDVRMAGVADRDTERQGRRGGLVAERCLQAGERVTVMGLSEMLFAAAE